MRKVAFSFHSPSNTIFMRNAQFFLICLFITRLSFANNTITISGKIYSEDIFSVKIFEPINGFYNQASVEFNSIPLRIAKDSFFYIYKPDINTGIFFSLELVHITKGVPIGRVNFLLCPGDSIHLSIRPEIQNSDWVHFSGDNDAGNNLFQKINYTPSEKFNDLFRLFSTLPAEKDNFVDSVNNIVDQFNSQFEKLYDKHKISSSYYNSIIKTLRQSFYSVVVTQFIHPNTISEKIPGNFRFKIIEALFEKLNPKEKELRALYNSYIYLRSYYFFEACKIRSVDFADLLETDTVIIFKNKKYLISQHLAYYLYISDLQVREDMWAIQLFAFFQLSPGLFDEKIISQFDELFPDSKYLKLIKEDFRKRNKVSDIEYIAQMPIIIEDTTIFVNNMQEIVSKFKGKPIYVDLWASWCGPCIAAFSFNKQVDSFLLANNIDRLYISLDENRKQWLTAIHKYQLGGFHIVANNLLIKDLKFLLSINKDSGIGIPHYLIYGESGRLLFNDAESPVNAAELFEELKKVIAQ